MSDLVSAYLEITARLDRITARCDGLVVDVRQRHDALSRWQAGVAARSSVDELEAALTEFSTGEPPSWVAVRTALEEWVEATKRALELWNALSTDQRAGLTPPAVRLPAEDGNC